MDSPTTTHREVEMQLTAVSGCGDPTTDGDFQGRAGDPLTMTRPAWGAVTTVLPTVTHVPIAVHDTPLSDADEVATVWFAQVAPPLSVVIMIPCPTLAPLRVSAVVPTTVQRTPGTPTVGTGGAVVVVVVGGVVVVVVVAAVVGGVAPEGADGGGTVDVVGGTGSAPLPVGDPLRQETPLREPMPVGVGTVIQPVPPSVVRAMAPTT